MNKGWLTILTYKCSCYNGNITGYTDKRDGFSLNLYVTHDVLLCCFLSYLVTCGNINANNPSPNSPLPFRNVQKMFAC